MFGRKVCAGNWTGPADSKDQSMTAERERERVNLDATSVIV